VADQISLVVDPEGQSVEPGPKRRMYRRIHPHPLVQVADADQPGGSFILKRNLSHRIGGFAESRQALLRQSGLLNANPEVRLTAGLCSFDHVENAPARVLIGYPHLQITDGRSVVTKLRYQAAVYSRTRSS